MFEKWETSGNDKSGTLTTPTGDEIWTAGTFVPLLVIMGRQNGIAPFEYNIKRTWSKLIYSKWVERSLSMPKFACICL